MVTHAATDLSHDPGLACWVDSAAGHREFPIQNLPLGVFSLPGGAMRCGIAIGDMILDLQALHAADVLPLEAQDACASCLGGTLNPLLARRAAPRRSLRSGVSALLSDPASPRADLLHEAAACTMHLPVQIGDYTDFYAGIHHATNIGRLFRPDNPLLPNYKHIPIGYHGRASSVRPSGVPVRRPKGQQKQPGADLPSFGPAQRLDHEVELGIWVAGGNALGEPIPIGQADDHVAGFCLLNDWSARDLQAWEYQPLGPFLAKSFQTTISPWIVTAEALLPFRLKQPARPDGDPRPLPYLWDEADQTSGALSLEVRAHLLTERMRQAGEPAFALSRIQATALYWTPAQLLTHHASNGCNLSPGDLLGTGTISGEAEGERGSLMEITSGGTRLLALPNGETRSYLQDGDEIVLSATASAKGFVSIGFGECRARVEPSPQGGLLAAHQPHADITEGLDCKRAVP